MRKYAPLSSAILWAVAASIALEVIAQCLPPHYSPVSQPESDLAVGPFGWVESISLLMRGLVTLMFLRVVLGLAPAGRRPPLGAFVLGISALGKVVLALAPTDLTARPETMHGVVHAIAALTAFLFGTAGQVLLARNAEVPWRRWLVGVSWVSVAACVVVVGTLPIYAQIHVWGLLERTLTVLFLGWIVLGTLNLRRRRVGHADTGAALDGGARAEMPTSAGQ